VSLCNARQDGDRIQWQDMLEASPKATVPVVVLPEGRVIEESLEVMLWALGESDPENWLAPLDSPSSDAKALIAECDRPFKRNLDRYKYPTRYEHVDPLAHRTEGLAFLKKLNSRLGSQPFLCGHRFSVADAAIAPFIRQFVNTDRDWFDGQGLVALTVWLDGILTSDRFLRVMEKYPKWEGGAAPLFP